MANRRCFLWILSGYPNTGAIGTELRMVCVKLAVKSPILVVNLLLNRYVFERWHGTLLILAMLLFAFAFNTLFAHQLPILECIVLVIHLCGFLCILIPLWVLAEKTSSRQVWTTFSDPGWGNQGLSCLVGIVASVAPLLGADAAGKYLLIPSCFKVLTAV